MHEWNLVTEELLQGWRTMRSGIPEFDEPLSTLELRRGDLSSSVSLWAYGAAGFEGRIHFILYFYFGSKH